MSMPGKCLHFHSPLSPVPSWHQTSPGSPLGLVMAALNQVLILSFICQTRKPKQ